MTRGPTLPTAREQSETAPSAPPAPTLPAVHERSETPRRIRVLPEDLSNQIAAGEVVERPSSVVKELLENALDAGARRVVVDVERGGEGLLRVADDGLGMDRDDARLAVLRHATSKLGSLEDLTHIESFGFRGEALPSIASVSRFELRTRRREDEEGTLVRVDGGGAAELAPCGCGVGTVVEVRDLFFNVPARKKFLKAANTESAHVTEVVLAAALGEPRVTFKLTRDGRLAREFLKVETREERVRTVHAGEELAVCRGERGPLAVEAFVSRPERARNGAAWLSIFVNGRPVRDRSLARSVALAYGSVLEPGRYPLGVAYLDLPPELVDVNVHPQKAEVRFADGRAVADALYKIVSGAVAAAFGLPEPGGFRGRKQKLFDEPAGPSAAAWVWGAGNAAEAPAANRDASPARAPSDLAPLEAVAALAARALDRTREAREDLASVPLGSPHALAASPSALRERDGEREGELAADFGLLDRLPSAPSPAAASGQPVPVPYPTSRELSAASERGQVAFGGLRFLVQVRSTYLVCEGNDGLYLLDQHAAAERVTFHRLRRAYDARQVATQKLLFPVVVAVGPLEVALIDEAQDALLALGLEVRPAGATQVAVHAVPLLLGRASPERLLRDLLGELDHSGERAFSGAIDRAIATMACHGSLRAGDPVPAEEARALLASLDEVDFAGHCPHGRPVVMRIGWGELEHRVGRR